MDDRFSRPKVKPEWSAVEKAVQIICLFILAGGIILLATQWSSLPATVATHFNASGAVDGTGDKSQLLMLPIISAVFYAFITVIERFPYIYNYPVEITEENANFQYGTAREMLTVVKTECVAVLTYLLWGAIETSKGVRHGLGSLFTVVFLVVLGATLAYYILRMTRHKKGEPL